MKKIIMTLALTTLVASMVGCSASASNTSNEPIVDQTNIVISSDNKDDVDPADCMLADQIAFETIPSHQIPTALESYIKMNETQQTFEIIDTEDGKYVVVYMGEKSSGGYAVEITGVLQVGEEFIVQVDELTPGKEDMVTMAFTYPLAIIKVDSDLMTMSNTRTEYYVPDGIVDQGSELPVEDYYTTPLDGYEVGEVIIVGEIVTIEGNMIHILSGDLIQVFKGNQEAFTSHYLNETVELVKTEDGFDMSSYIIDDFSSNYTTMGDIIESVKGTIVSIDNNDMTFETEEGETLLLKGGEYVAVAPGEAVTLEYISYGPEENYIIDVLSPSSYYELKILAIERLENGMMLLKATTDVDSEEVSYHVTIGNSTTVRLNVSEIKIGDVIGAYADEILESYPMQMTPKRVIK